MSINKIHINSTTKISLNDRFTVMQSVGPKSPLPQKSPRRRTQSASQDRNVPKASLANRKFLEQLDKKHKIQAALKLKRRSMKPNLPSKQRVRNRIGLKKGAAIAIRLAPNGKMARSNSLTNIATMKADLVKPALRRSNSTSSLASRLGMRRVGGTSGGQTPRRNLKRNAIVRAGSRQNLTRSNSTANLKRSNSRLSLRRSNSKTDLNRGQRIMQRRGLDNFQPQRRRILRKPFSNPNGKQQQARRSNSVSSRLGVKRTPMVRDRIRSANIRSRPGQSGAAQGRLMRRRNSTASLANAPKSGARQGRVSRPRGRGISSSLQRGRSRSNIRRGNSNTSLGRNNNINNKGNRSSSRARGRGIVRGRGRGRGISRPSAPKQDIKKEDLDKELDQYMATTREDVFMNNSY